MHHNKAETKKRFVRVICLVLAALMVLSALAAAVWQ